MVIDPLNRRTGSDTVNIYNEILGATYTSSMTVPGYTGPEIVTISDPIQGQYIAQVTGVSTGTYSVTTELT